MTLEIYDQIGINYSTLRKPDPRIEEVIWKELGNAKTILNIGAGGGSNEPRDRKVTAAEPSSIMIDQRPRGSANAIQASGGLIALPEYENRDDFLFVAGLPYEKVMEKVYAVIHHGG